MPFARPRRPLLRGALVGGAAYSAGRHAASAQQRETEQEQAISELQAQQTQQTQQAQPQPAPSAGSDSMDELSRLAEMHAKGLLNDAEFTAAKARLLGL
jgi:membrane protease subunit (stomatin/prohibitin family)